IVSKRGRYSEKYTQDNLREAVEKIRSNEMSYGAASQIYNIPKTNLHNKLKKPKNLPKGSTTVLSKEQESELADWILLHADFGDPRTKQDIILAAAEIAQLDSSTSGFKNGIPTSGWIRGFMTRHPLCRYKTPQSISKASAINTRDDFAGLWRNIYKYFEKTDQLDLLNRPELWWNADETCFEKDKVPRKVVARRGAKRVSRREMGPPKANTTVTYAFSAAGDYVEPLITLKDSVSTEAEIAFTLGALGANYGLNQTDSGWTKESFYYFVTIHLQNQWELKNIPKPRILVIDGYRAPKVSFG
ncbi:hypothetical protein Bhyg_03428, partial [Pseudolycoriella hygida]